MVLTKPIVPFDTRYNEISQEIFMNEMLENHERDSIIKSRPTPLCTSTNKGTVQLGPSKKFRVLINAHRPPPTPPLPPNS